MQIESAEFAHTAHSVYDNAIEYFKSKRTFSFANNRRNKTECLSIAFYI